MLAIKRIQLGTSIDANKKIWKELCQSNESSEIGVSSIHTNEVVDFYRDNLFDPQQFEEGYITAEDEDVSKLKGHAHLDKVLVRTQEYWDKKIQQLKEFRTDLLNLVERKVQQIWELEQKMLDQGE